MKNDISLEEKIKLSMIFDIEHYYGRKVIDGSCYETVLAEWHAYFINDGSFRKYLGDGKKLNYKLLEI